MSTFDNFEFSDENLDNPEAIPITTNDKRKKYINSPFTIVIDSNEQKPYEFKNIEGDFRNDYAKITVKTIRKRLPVADYSIDNMREIAIERKSKADLFGSVANGIKRENFIERLNKMQSRLRFGAVVVECNSIDIYTDPPEHTSLNPKSVYRTVLSWSQQYPLIHWFFCNDREFAEQTTYRILEKFYEHEVVTKYKHHNKPIDSNIGAFESGIIARSHYEEISVPYCQGNPLRVSWLRGWGFASVRFHEGNFGKVYEFGELPSEDDIKPAKRKGGKGKAFLENEDRTPLPSQTTFLDDRPMEELSGLMGKFFSDSCKNHPVDKSMLKKTKK